jgi:hypothetical protein
MRRFITRMLRHSLKLVCHFSPTYLVTFILFVPPPDLGKTFVMYTPAASTMADHAIVHKF